MMEKTKEIIKLYGKIKLIMNIVGMALAILAYALAWIWFGWKLALVIFLAIMANNFERFGK